MMGNLTPSRLVLARKRTRLTLTELAGRCGVSRRSITAYENGRATPSPENINSLARALGVSTDFLRGYDIPEIAPDSLSFRAMSKMPASQRDAAGASARIAMIISDHIEARFRLPEPDLPTLPHLGPEEAAERVRDSWGLGNGPIPNMIHLLESRGVKVFSLAADCAAVDAFCTYHEDSGQPFVFLNLAKSGERGRFDAAHELGHLVMHVAHRVPHGPQAEQEAQAFASAFLMNRESILSSSLRRQANLEAILAAKKYWKVAAVALTYRLHDLSLVNDWQYRTIVKALSQRGYRRSEHDGIPRETSQLLRKVLAQDMKRGRTIRQLADEIGIDIEELNTHLFGLVPISISRSAGDAQVVEQVQGSGHARPALRLVSE